jgi:hypothetical protein
VLCVACAAAYANDDDSDEARAAEETVAEERAAAQAEYADPSMYVHPLTNIPAASKDVRTVVVFPKHPIKRTLAVWQPWPWLQRGSDRVAPPPARVRDAGFQVGEIASVVCGFKNTGAKDMNISVVFGSINSKFQYSVFIQNVRRCRVLCCRLFCVAAMVCVRCGV